MPGNFLSPEAKAGIFSFLCYMKNNSSAFLLLLTLLSAAPLAAQKFDPAEKQSPLSPDVTLLLACDNVTNPGLVCCNQTICLGDTTLTLTETEAPSGGSGQIEFHWLVLKTEPGVMPTWTVFPGANDAFFPPIVPTETKYLMREAKRTDCVNWLASNIVTITVLPAGDPGCLASGTHSAEVSPFKVSPNPAGTFTHVYNGSPETADVFIRDLNGKLLTHVQVPGGSETAVDCAAWPAGVYTLQGKTNEGKVYVNKIVKL